MIDIDLENLDLENTFFHFTATSNLENIEKEGLVPQIGNNARGAEKTFKVFFSKGTKGIIELTNVWIQWTMYRLYVSALRDKLGPQRQMNEEYFVARKDFISKTVPNYEELKEEAIQKLIKDYSNCSYLALELKEGEDYLLNDIDECKEKTKDNEFLELMYCKPLPVGDLSMETWNMHTITDKKITKDKINIVSSFGQIDALSIIKRAYELEKTEDMNLPFLDDLINTINETKKL